MAQRIAGFDKVRICSQKIHTSRPCNCYTYRSITNEQESGDEMKDPLKKTYVYLMLSIFGAISFSILVFFLLYRFQGVGDVFHRLRDILAPFIYGGVVAYLLRPVCNFYEGLLLKYLPGKLKKT